jgi:hypothetical protein
VPGGKEHRRGSPGGNGRARGCPLADKVVKRLPAAVGGKPLQGDYTLAGAAGQAFTGDEGTVAWMVFRYHGITSIRYGPRRATASL